MRPLPQRERLRGIHPPQVFPGADFLKYTFSLNTNVGVVTKTIDPETINNLLSKDAFPALKSDKDKPWIQDKSVVFSLEFKF
jgi:hypothetical protein